MKENIDSLTVILFVLYTGWPTKNDKFKRQPLGGATVIANYETGSFSKNIQLKTYFTYCHSNHWKTWFLKLEYFVLYN